MDLYPGLWAEKTILVESKFSAAHLGSGNVEVYATPSMVLHMEETALEAVDHLLGPGRATVGAFIGVKHLAPTPLGMKVKIRAELVKVEGRTLGFTVQAWDEVDKIGEAEHTRVVIDLDRFKAKLDVKKAQGETKGEQS
jgi:predicted thioesterase